MNKTNSAKDAVSIRVIGEITFHASILALHQAIESAGENAAPMAADDELHSLVERARPPVRSAEDLPWPDSRGFLSDSL